MENPEDVTRRHAAFLARLDADRRAARIADVAAIVAAFLAADTWLLTVNPHRTLLPAHITAWAEAYVARESECSR